MLISCLVTVSCQYTRHMHNLLDIYHIQVGLFQALPFPLQSAKCPLSYIRDNSEKHVHRNWVEAIRPTMWLTGCRVRPAGGSRANKTVRPSAGQIIAAVATATVEMTDFLFKLITLNKIQSYCRTYINNNKNATPIVYISYYVIVSNSALCGFCLFVCLLVLCMTWNFLS